MLISIFLSPAKALDLTPLDAQQQKLLANFETSAGFKFQESQFLVDYLCQKNSQELAELLEISNDLANLNYERYQKYWQASTAGADFATQQIISEGMKPAAFTFNGDAYQHLDIHSLALPALSYLDQYLWIFSGLYGFLKAFDYIKPYRIDMGTNIDLEINYNNNKFKNLYQIWQPILVNAWFDLYLKPRLEKNEPWLLNLASQEYAKAFSLKNLKPENQAFLKQLLKQNNIDLKYVDIDFKQRKKDGSFASIGIKNKQARGAFLRYMAENQITQIEDCYDFNEEGYVFSPEQSKYSDSLISLVFLQKL